MDNVLHLKIKIITIDPFSESPTNKENQKRPPVDQNYQRVEKYPNKTDDKNIL